MSSEVWDRWNEGQGRRFPHDKVVDFVQLNFAIPVTPGTKAVDLGCGGGTEVRYLMECGFDVTAIDSSPVAIATTQALVADLPGTLEVQLASVSQCELPARSFACAISIGVLDAAGLEEARLAVPRLVDALKPGGKALLVFASKGDFRITQFPDLDLHGFSRREVESMIVLEFGAGVWIDTATTTYQHNAIRQIDWLVTMAKR